MIIYNPKSWLSLIFRFHKSDTFRRLLPYLLLLALYSSIVAYVEIEILNLKYVATGTIHSLLGFVISLLLVFRTNTAYERWWEGRKAWGTLVNCSRNLAIKLDAFLPQDNVESRKELAALLSDYASALRLHLRNEKMDPLPTDVHQPNAIAISIAKKLNAFYKDGLISGEQLYMLNAELSELTNVCGICERIKKTPIPFSYSMFLKKFVFVYIFTMPFAFVKELGYSIIIAAVLLFYVLVSLELIAEEIEDPFGTDTNDLPTDDIAETIKHNVYEILIK